MGEMMHRVQEAANAAVLEADTSIANALAKITHSGQLQSRATSFLATKATDKGRISTFQVHVPLVDVPGNAAGASIRALEQARAENERHMFEQAVNDLRALPGSVVEKLEDLVRQRLGQLRVPTSFLEESNQGSRTLANEGNIRVVDFRNVGKLQNCFYQIGGAAGNECQGPAGLRQSHQKLPGSFS